jgi:hypothetical protein
VRRNQILRQRVKHEGVIGIGRMAKRQRRLFHFSKLDLRPDPKKRMPCSSSALIVHLQQLQHWHSLSTERAEVAARIKFLKFPNKFGIITNEIFFDLRSPVAFFPT